MMRIAKTALGVAVVGSLLLGGTSAFGASARAGGAVKVFVTLKGNANGAIVITGAIGDYGKTVDVNSAGKPQKNGGYEQLALKDGSILINGAQIKAALNNASPTDFSAVTCSGSLDAVALTPIVSGTKAYSGIAGSLTLTVSFAFVGPFFTSGSKKGQCNTNANAPAPPGLYASITGTGTVSFA
jgi:hypothetical protein